ncbi:MAG: ATP-dependent protease subunit HslV [bacterium]
MKGTTIIAVKKDGEVAIGGDGQVSLENTIIKHKAKKIRRIYEEKVLAGFSGSVADAFTLVERFEGKIKEYKGNLQRAAVELAKEWRMDKYLRRLEAMLVVCDKESLLLISGGGEVIEPDDGILSTGSGGPYALASARALIKHSNLNAREIVEESLRIASEVCLYTNSNITVEVLE